MAKRDLYTESSLGHLAPFFLESGWTVYGYELRDMSADFYEEYNSDKWSGVAEKNGYVLVLYMDESNRSYSGKKDNLSNYRQDDKSSVIIQKLDARIADSATTQSEKETAQKMKEKVLAKDTEGGAVIMYPVFSANPRGSDWHLEKDGEILHSGRIVRKIAGAKRSFRHSRSGPVASMTADMFGVLENTDKSNEAYCNLVQFLKKLDNLVEGSAKSKLQSPKIEARVNVDLMVKAIKSARADSDLQSIGDMLYQVFSIEEIIMVCQKLGYNASVTKGDKKLLIKELIKQIKS